ncbi:MAG: PCMD domain-containing protein [Lachnoclostridium sp.]|nr:PCMD domain-containing protein [Lachnoclostridium sp.]
MSRFKSKYTAIAAMLTLAVMMMLQGCIHNDIPYPRIKPQFTSFKVLGELQPTAIDTINNTITVYLDESTDIYNVVLSEYVLTPENSVWNDSVEFLNGIDLARPVTTTVALYQEYAWKVTAIQNIERYFTIANQVGSATIDAVGHRVIAYVSSSTPLSSVKVNTIKLGGSDAVMSPDLNGKTVDFNSPVTVDVTEHGRTVRWTIYITQTEATVTTDRVDAWSMVAWAYGTAEAGKENGFEYRKASDSSWTRLADADITHSGGSFTGRISGLTPQTSYVVRAYSGTDYGDEIEVTTQGVSQLPNSDFENWWLDGKVWNPWAEGGTSFWDTGNKGATTLGPSNTTPSDDTPTGTGRSARLETKFVGIGIIGKLAAGNIFAGSYVRTDGTNGILSFGRDFNLRPTRLTGWLKYHSAPISSTTTGFTDLKNEPDTAVVWCALIDSAEPFEIRTNPSNRHLFNPDGDEVVGYGILETGKSDAAEQWHEFKVDIAYKSTSRVPRYILVVASASKYGDYFTGGNGSLLYVDDFKLEYDY